MHIQYLRWIVIMDSWGGKYAIKVEKADLFVFVL